MEKSYEGNKPKTEGWVKLENYDGVDGTWNVWVQHQQPESRRWLTVKVFASGRVARKANYWVTKSLRTGYIGRFRDYAILRETRSDLHRHVEDQLSNYLRNYHD